MVAGALSMVLLGGCYQQACLLTQRAIAVRTWDCTGNWELGEGRARRLTAVPNTCIDEDALGAQCARAIEGLTCAEVEQLGDDVSAWLAVDPSCEGIFALEADGFGATAATAVGVTPQSECPCPTAHGEEVSVTFVNQTDRELELHEVAVDDCIRFTTGNGMRILPGGIGDLPLPLGGVFHLDEYRNSLDFGCFTVEEGLTVTIPVDAVGRVP